MTTRRLGFGCKCVRLQEEICKLRAVQAEEVAAHSLATLPEAQKIQDLTNESCERGKALDMLRAESAEDTAAAELVLLLEWLDGDCTCGKHTSLRKCRNCSRRSVCSVLRGTVRLHMTTN
eukprot:240431-Amphidinium_carterae.1